MAPLALALLWLAIALPPTSENGNSPALTNSLPPESCAPPPLSRQELSIAAGNDGALKWTSDLAAGLTTAEAQHQEVLIYFRAEGCTDCDQMHAVAMADAYIQTRLASYILVRIDIEANRETARKYGITTVPAVVRLSSEGVIVRKYVGLLDKDSMLDFLRQ